MVSEDIDIWKHCEIQTQMGATRKLQGEIDKVLKKVQEGVDVFDSIWNKVHDTENANQKEKYEADLKKEIKKLQRYRDQIKTWLQSSEIKDKKALLDARKLIEKEMERFKICEKETKTKAFSKEGLGQQPKTDPREKAKAESRDWLNNMVSELESQVESFEAELEGFTVKKGRNRPPRLGHLEESISRHKAHITRLEQILRLLDNDGLGPDHVSEIKDGVEDYVDRNQDDFDDFSEVDDIYSSIPIEKIEALENMDAIAAAAIVKGPKDVVSISQPALDDSTIVESGSKTPPLQTQQDAPVPVVTGNSPASATAANGNSGINVSTPAILTSIRPSKSNNTSVPSSPVSVTGPANEEGSGSYFGHNSSLSRGTGQGTLSMGINSAQSSPLVPSSSPSSSPVVTTSSHGIASSIQDLTKRNTLTGDERLISGGSTAEGGIMGTRLFTSPGGQWRSSSALPFQPSETGQFLPRTEIAPDQKQKFIQRFQQLNNPLLASSQQISHLGPTNQKLQQQPSLGQAASSPMTSPQIGLEAPTLVSQYSVLPTAVSGKEHAEAIGEVSPSHKLSDEIGGSSTIADMTRSGNVEQPSPSLPPAQISVPGPGVIGRRNVTDLGAIGDNLINNAANDQLYNLQMLEAAFHKIPLPKDSEQLRRYTPRHPAVTPASYPQAPAELIDNPAFWERFNTDVLFFAFYYQQGTYQQYLAARELKKHSWRYHKKYNTWFQRHEEPKATTDEYEQGTYVYFDFHILHDDFQQQGWCQRIKTEFTFEYSYLEDELVV